MNDEETFKVTIRMFIEFDLINQFRIPYKVNLAGNIRDNEAAKS